MERDMSECGLKRDDAQDRGKWRKLSWGITGQPSVRGKNGHKTIVVAAVECPIYLTNPVLLGTDLTMQSWQVLPGILSHSRNAGR